MSLELVRYNELVETLEKTMGIICKRTRKRILVELERNEIYKPISCKQLGKK